MVTNADALNVPPFNHSVYSCLFLPFLKKKWNKHPKFVNTEKWTQLHIQRIDINFDFFHVENKKPTNKEVHNQKKDKLKNIL